VKPVENLLGLSNLAEGAEAKLVAGSLLSIRWKLQPLERITVLVKKLFFTDSFTFIVTAAALLLS